MAVPVVAIVGRPNVGKSSLFNWLAGRRISIVDPTAGVTRDRVGTLVNVGERYFELVDTGGMGIEDSDNLTEQVEGQIRTAITEADVILFVVDARDGLVPLDEEVAARLQPVSKPVVLVANKCDTPGLEMNAAEFFRVGRGRPVCVSAGQNRNKDELHRAILHVLPAASGDEQPAEVEMKVAVVGRRNAGKSTFINSLAKADRMIVSEVAGTTRDSVDIRFERDGKSFIAIDTAGVRKKRSIASDVEFYSMARAERSIRRADVVFMFFDPRLRVSRVDKALVEYCLDQHKPLILVVNKWDLVRQVMPTEKFGKYLIAMFPMLDYVPIAFITAQSGKNVQALLNLAQNLHKQASQRVSTADLNRVIRQAVEAQPAPTKMNRRPKVYYATQVASNPPTVVLFTNGPELFEKTYERYLTRYLRDHLPFGEVPIKLYLRSKKDQPAGVGAGGGADDDDGIIVEEPTGPARSLDKPRKARKPAAPDLSGLKFRTDVDDDEVRKFDSGLWKDL